MTPQRHWALLLFLAACGPAPGSLDESKGRSWVLPDQAVLIVNADPWPAESGETKIFLNVGPVNGARDAFDGTAAIRPTGTADWTALSPRGTDAGHSLFSGTVTLREGKNAFTVRVDGGRYGKNWEYIWKFRAAAE